MKIKVPLYGTFLIRHAEVFINSERWHAVDPEIFDGVELRRDGLFWVLEPLDGNEFFLNINGRGITLPMKNAYRLMVTKCGD